MLARMSEGGRNDELLLHPGWGNAMFRSCVDFVLNDLLLNCNYFIICRLILKM